MNYTRKIRSTLLVTLCFGFLTLGLWIDVGPSAAEDARAYEALVAVSRGESANVPHNNSVYLLSEKVTPTPGTSGDNFGYSVAISGQYAVVGAPQVSSGKGAAYVFERNGAEWDQLQVLSLGVAGVDNDKYGWGVDIDGDTIIVGAPLREVGGTDAKGSAYIYTLDDGSFGNEVELVNSCDFNCGKDPKAPDDLDFGGEQFGVAVAVNGDIAIVGAYDDKLYDDNQSSREGSASRFVRASGVWPSTGTKTPGVQKSSAFGRSVAVSGGLAIIGAPSYTAGGIGGHGAAYRYGTSGIAWGSATPTPTYVGGGSAYFLGSSVAIYDGASKDVAVMGAWGVDFATGAAYISESSSFGTMTALTPSSPPSGGAHYGISVTIDGDMVIVGTLPNTGAGAAYVFRDTGASWDFKKILFGNVSNDQFGYSVSVDQNEILVGSPGFELAAFFTNTFHRIADRNGDGGSDVSVYRPSSTPSNNFWYIALPTGTPESSQFGTTGDSPAPMDYDGDGKMDLAVFRPSGQDWYVLNSSTSSLSTINDWGLSTDIPMPQDFDHDGKTDIAVYRSSTGYFYWRKSSDSNTGSYQLSTTGDKPVIADMDGDGFADPTVFRSSNGTWYSYNTVTQQDDSYQFGTSGDVPVSGDFDGDLKTDFAVFRPSTNYWYIEFSSNGEFVQTQFGSSGDIPAAGDHDGDGEADIAVFRPSTGYWHILRSRDGSNSIPFGTSGDIPLPAAYNQ